MVAVHVPCMRGPWIPYASCKRQQAAAHVSFPPMLIERCQTVSEPFWFSLVGSACVKQAMGAHPAMSTYIKLSCMHDFMQPCSIPSPLDQAFPLMQNQGPKT